MDREFYHNEFEELIKEKADQYKMYPSDKVWKSIDRSLRSRRKWYWSGFVILLSGVSYLAITELLSPARHTAVNIQAPPKQVTHFNTAELNPFRIGAVPEALDNNDATAVITDLTVEDSGNLTASFDIPLGYFDATEPAGSAVPRGSLVIGGLQPLEKDEAYQIELSWPAPVNHFVSPGEFWDAAASAKKLSASENVAEKGLENWLKENAQITARPLPGLKKISWQLAFSPAMNYRKLRGSTNSKSGSESTSIPLSPDLDGDVNRLVNHKPALGFELGTHAMLPLTNRLTIKGGIQFNYSKYDIRAFQAARELAVIALNSTDGSDPGSLTSYTNIRNFSGTSTENLKNQYYQLSLPVGLEFHVLGNGRLQLNIAGTVQPTYLLNRNTYLITTDFKNYTTAPSLVRRWNMNAGAEAYLSYNRGDVKWQIGPQFRYQLLSSYDNAYPIREYLMEYGIKIGITKTIR